MTNLKQVNQLLVSELKYLYKFEIADIYFNSLEGDSDTYENFFIRTMDNEIFFFKHVSGYSFEVEKGTYSPKRFLVVTSTLFEGLRDITIKNTLKKQIETFNTLLKDTDRRIEELQESKFYYDTKRDEAITLLRKLEGENK